VPGRMKWWTSASSAVRLRRGSITTTVPPRPRMARSRPFMSGAVIRLPFETSGSAPRTRRKSVRSRSGTGTLRPVPNMRPTATCFGIWSTVLAEKTRRVPSAFRRTRVASPISKLCTDGLPR
jgi:hypothetical protein